MAPRRTSHESQSLPGSVGALLASAPAFVMAQTAVQAPAQQQGATEAGARSPVPDALFAAAAASSGMAELNVSQIGMQRATDPELKRFSQQMIDDHTRMNQE